MSNSDPRFSAESCGLPLSVGSAVDYIDGAMKWERREYQQRWQIVRDHIMTPAQSVGMREALERIAKQQLVEERLVEGGDYEYGYEQIVKIARAALASQPTLRCPACASANVSRNPNGWFDCRYCNKMGSEEEFASQPSPAATVETDTSEGCRCMFCGARTLTTCTPEKPAEGCLRPRLSAATGDAFETYRETTRKVATAREKGYAAARENLREAWSALAMIREAVETLAPSGSVKAAEHLDGPTFMHEAEALVAGIMALTATEPQTLSVQEMRQKAEDAIRAFCQSLGGAAVQMSHGEERIYYAGLSLKALSAAVAMAVTRPHLARGDK